MIQKLAVTPTLKAYRRAWRMFDLELITNKELIQMLHEIKNPKL